MVNAILMLEILGKPADYVKETLEKLVEQIGNQQNVRIIEKKIAEPKKLEKSKELFTTFGEIHVETGLHELMILCFNFMPSHVEIITPEELKLSNSEMNLVLNELVRRLHQYDEVAKTVLIERNILAEQIKSGKLKVQIVKERKKARKKRS